MAETFYVTIKGQKQGAIKGDVTQKGREGTIPGLALSHDVVSPRDAASGLPTGKRMHKPLTITTPWGSATPKLFTALFTNENLTSVNMRFWRPAATGGTEIQFMTIDLTNASISDIQSQVPDVRDPALAKYEEYHEISFTYQKIQITYTDGAITATDDWSVSNA